MSPHESHGLVWPGVSAALWQSIPQSPAVQADDASKLKGSAFSFDWSRGTSSWKDRGGKRDSSSTVPFLSSFGDGLPFSSRQRWKHFVALLLVSACMFMLAGAFLPLVLLRPQKFCLFFTLGSMLSMASFAVLRGPLEQLKHMFSLQRLPFTSTYVGSMVLTLYAALVLQSYVLVLLFSALQAGAVAWYLLSYIPGGAPILKLLTRGCLRAVSALCCRAASDRASSPWPSLSRGPSSGLLPL